MFLLFGDLRIWALILGAMVALLVASVLYRARRGYREEPDASGIELNPADDAEDLAATERRIAEIERDARAADR